jgi:two-component system alkaline phosphatase synthesis response regulator PhoP
VVKPFSTRELLLRIRALLRRSSGTAPGLAIEGGKIKLGSALVDFAAYSVTRDGAKSGLSRKELELLRYFLAHEGETLDRGRVLDEVWGKDEFPTARTIDTHVLKLRKKIEASPEAPRHLLTVHGVGYRFSRRGEP